MSKEIELQIEIDEKGKIKVTPKGTNGEECLDLMKFLDKINGTKNTETILNDDYYKNIYNQQKIKNKLN